MPSELSAAQPLFLTTREVADLIRVKERKVYDLAAAGEIPHRRVTGKLLFPRDEILLWIQGEGDKTPAIQDRPPVVTGSHDPLLDWAIRESDCGLATLFNGSSEGLSGFMAGRAVASGLHIPSDTDWNIDAVEERKMTDCVLLSWATRQRGLILSQEAEADIATLGDTSGLRFVQRQAGAGAQALLGRLLAEAKMTPSAFDPASPVARTESDAAAMVADGEGDVALGLAAMAKRYSLRFVPLLQERYDLIFDRRAYFTDPVQHLIAFLGSEALQTKARAMTGYDVSDCGRVRWNAP
ncbi:substrate-binding domain-containing protein [Tropicimonas sp. S265A]|uniref:substrate-binding domain-containing protein n=1 Tax=Tropicimonas sp. S265A TaxID=3415134 RepID=UPI003C7A8D6C